LTDEQRRSVCDHFALGNKDIPEQGDWQGLGLCTTSQTMEQLQLADRLCKSCFDGKDVCKEPPTLIFHQFLDALHEHNWKANLLSMQSVLVRSPSC
jgi:hypothetical protein